MPVPDHVLAVGCIRRPRWKSNCAGPTNRWLTEVLLPQADGRLYSMLSLPLSDTDEALPRSKPSVTAST